MPSPPCPCDLGIADRETNVYREKDCRVGRREVQEQRDS